MMPSLLPRPGDDDDSSDDDEPDATRVDPARQKWVCRVGLSLTSWRCRTLIFEVIFSNLDIPLAIKRAWREMTQDLIHLESTSLLEFLGWNAGTLASALRGISNRYLERNVGVWDMPSVAVIQRGVLPPYFYWRIEDFLCALIKLRISEGPAANMLGVTNINLQAVAVPMIEMISSFYSGMVQTIVSHPHFIFQTFTLFLIPHLPTFQASTSSVQFSNIVIHVESHEVLICPMADLSLYLRYELEIGSQISGPFVTDQNGFDSVAIENHPNHERVYQAIRQFWAIEMHGDYHNIDSFLQSLKAVAVLVGFMEG